MRFPNTNLVTIRTDLADLDHADLTRRLDLRSTDAPPLDGLVAANSLHFIDSSAQIDTIRALVSSLRPSGRFIVVEYDADRGNEWVPHPFSFERWTAMSVAAGLSVPSRIGRVPSRFLGAIYAAVSERPGPSLQVGYPG